MEVKHFVILLFVIQSFLSCQSSQMTDTETIHTVAIVTDHDCQDFIDTRHKYSRMTVHFNKTTHDVHFGENLDIAACVELCMTEGKILLLSFYEHVPVQVIRNMARVSNTMNIWLSFTVAAGPNCMWIRSFANQTVPPFSSTVLGFCEGEEGPQKGYTTESVKNLLGIIAKVKQPGDLSIVLNGQLVLDSEATVHWAVVKRRAKKLIIQSQGRDWSRKKVLKRLEINETMVIWDDIGSRGSREYGFIFLLFIGIFGIFFVKQETNIKWQSSFD